MFCISNSKILNEVRVITLTVFEDFRGQYVEIYNEELWKELNIPVFVQDDISVSRKNVLRGIHGDKKTWKLIQCLYGSFYLVVTDGVKWDAFTLSDTNRKMILVPPGYGNGHLILTDTAIFHYKQTTVYDRESQFTLKWNDKKLNIFWPISNPILSERDQF